MVSYHQVSGKGTRAWWVLEAQLPALATKLHTNKGVHITPLNTYLQELMKQVEYMHWYFGSLHTDLEVSKKMTAVFNEFIEI